MHNDNKLYYECLALAILSDPCIGLKNLRKSERPDLICSEDSLGIEVVRAISTREGQYDGDCDKFFNSPYCDKEKIERKIKDASGVGELISPPLDDTNKIVIDKFQKKIESINKRDYAICQSYFLFIHTSIHFDEAAEQDTLNMMCEINRGTYARKFKKVYIYDMEKLYVYDLEKKEFESIFICKEKKLEWIDQTKKLKCIKQVVDKKAPSQWTVPPGKDKEKRVLR